MEDEAIIELFWERSERAISETQKKYGQRLNRLSYSILSSHEDAEECINDTLLAAWNQIPPDRPEFFFAYLSKIVRNQSYKRFRDSHRQKRGGLDNVLEELEESVAYDVPDEAEETDSKAITACLNSFLAELSAEKRTIFIKRYYFSEELATIAKEMQMSEVNVRKILSRVRQALKERLKEEDVSL